MTNKLQTSAIILIVVLMLGAVAFLVLQENHANPFINTNKTSQVNNSHSTLPVFSNVEELANVLKDQVSEGRGYAMADSFLAGGIAPTAAVGKAAAAETTSSSASASYSKTNVQVKGVDEPDFVKNDGKYIYVMSESNLSIVDAYPANNAKILSVININGTAQNIFINGNNLIVFGQEPYSYEPRPMPLAVKCLGAAKGGCITPPYYYTQKSFVKIYDISDRDSPVLKKTLAYDGSYFDARMIGDFVYLVAQQPITYYNESIIMPTIEYSSGSTLSSMDIMPRDIHYFDMPDYNYQLTTIFAIDLSSSSQPTKNTFLTGYSQNMYVSNNNIYLVSQKYMPYNERQKIIFEKVMLSLVDDATAIKMREIQAGNLSAWEKQDKINGLWETYYNKLIDNEKTSLLQRYNNKTQEIEAEIDKELQKTIIHKISINQEKIEYNSRGSVPGHILNQFSMDEFDGNFRIATTTGDVWNGNSLNHIYVLDENLVQIGALENLARTEKIYSVRFMGNRAYMVTFKKVDPLFVIDLSNPRAPKVLGELKIPGYSDYLHPYDENHIIGIGKEAADASQEEVTSRNLDFAWYQGVKLSLFDVTDVAHPKEISKFGIGDRGTDSEALYEHKAFLFDKEKNLLVIPVSVSEINREQYEPSAITPTTYGVPTFLGAYVFSLDLENGFKLKGRITHLNATEEAEMKSRSYYYNNDAQIRRSLYIDNVLYTISNGKIKANSLADLSEIKEISLPQSYIGRYMLGV